MGQHNVTDIFDCQNTNMFPDHMATTF